MIDLEKSVRGTQLTMEDQRTVLAQFVHRYTKDHTPMWATREWKNGKTYPCQYASDQEWLANTRFQVRKDGRLDNRIGSCFSTGQTWPDNPELRKV